MTIDSLAMAAEAGSSVEVYLEDDFQVPDSIDRDTVYFTVDQSQVQTRMMAAVCMPPTPSTSATQTTSAAMTTGPFGFTFLT